MRARAAWLLLAAACGACASAPEPRPVAVDSLLPGALAPPRAVVLAEIEGLVRERAPFLAARTAERFLGEAHAELLAYGVSEAAASALPGGAAGWIALARDVAARPELHQRLAAVRGEVATALQVGDLAAATAAADAAVGEAPAGLPAGVARAWAAFAAAAAGEPLDANASRFAAAVQELTATSPVLATQVGLLGHAVHGDADAWRAAVVRLGDSLRARPGLCTPALWERAQATRPTGVAWPAEAEAGWRAAAGLDAAAFAADRDGGLLIYAIALAHQRRGDALAALVAHSRLAHSPVPAVRGLSAVGQAKALVSLGRSGDARAVLVAAIASDDPLARAAGLAQLGAIELVEDRPTVASALLREALAVEGAVWADRAGALANQAIVRELAGDADAARAFATARAELAAAGDVDGLLLCLENEASLLATRDPAAATRARTLLEAVRAGGLAVLGPMR